MGVGEQSLGVGLAQTGVPSRPSVPRLFALRADLPATLYGGIALSSFILILSAWAVASYGGFVSSFILPTPSAVASSAARLLTETLPSDAGISVFRVVMGFLISAAIAIPLGLLIGVYKPVEAFVEPFVGFVRYLPAAAFIPLVMVWFGIGENAKIAIIFIGTFFQMVLVVADVARAVPSDLINVSLTLGAKPAQVLRHVLVPATLPGLLDTMRIMVGWAWTYLVVAELVAAHSGLGFRILKSQRFLQTSDVFVGILAIGLLGLATDILFRVVAARIVPWAAIQRRS